MRITQSLSALLLSSILLVALGCTTALPPTAVPKPTATPTASPTLTPTSIPIAEDSSIPTATAAPASTPAPSATPVPTPQPSEAIAFLEWVDDGLARSEVPLVDLLEVASATSQTYFRAPMDTPWVREKQGASTWQRTVRALNRLAAVEEIAALRMMELELADTVDYSDLEAIEFMLTPAASDPEGLRRLLANTSVEESARDGADGFLPVLYMDMDDPEAAAVVRALPCVGNGLNSREFSHVVDFAELALHSPQAFWAALREERDWTPPNLGSIKFPEALSLIGSVAAVDEAAALRIIDIPSLEPMEEPDYYELERLAAMAESEPRRLSEVLDHPAVAAGEEALVPSVVLLLDLRARDSEASATLEGMPWMQEGILKYMADATSVDAELLRQDAADIFDLLLLLEHDPPSGRELFLAVAAKEWMRNGMLEHEREVVSSLLSKRDPDRERAQILVRGQSLDAIAGLRWMHREDARYEAADLRALLQHAAMEDDRVFKALLDRPWVRNGLVNQEA